MQTQILGLLTPLMTLFFAATFVVFWRLGRMKRHVLGYGIAFGLAAVAFLITHLSPSDAFYVFHATQAFYSLSAVFLLASVCERAGVQLHLPSMAGVYILSASMLALTVSVSDFAGPRLVIVNTGYGVMFAMGLATLLTARRRSLMDMAIIAVIAFQAADFLIRPTLTLTLEGAIPAEVYRESIYYSLIGLVLGIRGVITAVVFMGATVAEWTKSVRESNDRDALTGLQNRAAFEKSMSELLTRAQDEERPVSLVVADIDHFKQVNDIWGHQAGDHALAGFGGLIQKMVRGCDFAGRVGGEEFCIAVWNCENEPAERLAERIRRAFSRLEHAEINREVSLTASFGVATVRPGETYDRLFARADAALYEAKSLGRDRVETAERMKASDDVRSAVPFPLEINPARATG